MNTPWILNTTTALILRDFAKYQYKLFEQIRYYEMILSKSNAIE